MLTLSVAESKWTAYMREYSRRNRDRINSQKRQRNKDNPKLRSESNRRYKQKYPEERNASSAKYRAAKDQRIPKWANLEMIQEFYKNCPKGMHVDHIIPLRGETVSGLHVENNLQYLTPSENSSKGARF